MDTEHQLFIRLVKEHKNNFNKPSEKNALSNLTTEATPRQT